MRMCPLGPRGASDSRAPPCTETSDLGRYKYFSAVPLPRDGRTSTVVWIPDRGWAGIRGSPHRPRGTGCAVRNRARRRAGTARSSGRRRTSRARARRSPRTARPPRDARPARPRSRRGRDRARRDRPARPAAIAAGSSPSDAAAVDGQALPQRARRAVLSRAYEDVPPAGLAAREALGLARLLERVEAGVRVGAERHRHAARPQPGRRQEAVAEVRLGARAGAHRRSARGHQVELGVVGVRRVDDRRPRPEQPDRVEQRDRAQAVLGERLVDLARLLVGVDVHRQARRGCVAGDLLEPVARHGAHRVRRIADRDQRIAPELGAQRVDAREVGLGGARRRSGAGPASAAGRAPARA